LLLGLLCFTGAIFAAPGKPAEAAGGKPAQVCDKQQQQCAKQCDKEKKFWFFKGEAYESCAAKCDARHAACMETGQGDNSQEAAAEARERGQSGQEMRKQHGGQQGASDAEMNTDDNNAAAEETDEPPDAAANQDRPAADKARGKGKKKDD